MLSQQLLLEGKVLEIEVKAPITNLQTIKNRIKEIGGKILFKGQQIDIYFQHPCKNFEETDEALRIRKIGEEAYLTYKGSRIKSNLKARLEIETPIPDFNSMKKILLKLGFKPVMEIRKNRETWLIDNMRINLDEVEKLGKFIEIEVISKEIEEGEKKILGLLKKLGIKKNEIIKKTYFEMIKETKNFNTMKGNKLIVKT